MSEEPARKSHALAWTLSIIAVPVLYLLSLGPAFYLSYRFYSSDSVAPWLLAYEVPLGYAGDTPIGPLADMYINWWLRLAGDHGSRF